MRARKTLSREMIKQEGQAGVSSLYFILSMLVRDCFSQSRVAAARGKNNSYDPRERLVR